MVSGTVRDALRSVYLWFVLGGLLLLRRANRTRAAWTIVLPLPAVYGVLHVIERTVNSHISWTGSPYLCSALCEMLRSFALGLAVLLAVSDLIRIRRRSLRAATVFLILVAAGSAAAILNAPLLVVWGTEPSFGLSTPVWSIVFGIVVLVFLIGLSVSTGLLRRFAGRHVLAWCAGICLTLAIASALALAGTKLLVDSTPLLSRQQAFFTVGALLQPFLAPYLVFFWFVLPALRSPFYHQRFAGCFLNGPAQ